MINRRLNKRINLKPPIAAKAKIFEFENVELVSDRYALFHVENISLTGLRLRSDLDFPIMKELILSLEVSLFGRENYLLGTIVWKKKSGEQFVYGFEIRSTNIGYMQSVTLLTKE
ncbi:PilZ domain-containing protein [Halalkalibacter nanhaiisediminis]|uniref:PilZ domain-containing protein n=1 Tax=Halalkalibacter nanhaiisediminis TaxID=688079 RepID=A0A562QTC1_9BACI|nr:PilZ domain-containing protein [Halalkalibacter nanhaiisediminis]TWI59989.1 PilZ domain-containing protein [Halalkalibacter nanhaiisediminis]